MRQFMTGGRVLALAACLGIATGCGSAVTLAAHRPFPARSSAKPADTVRATPAAAAPRAGVKRAVLLFGVWCGRQRCITAGGYYYGSAASHTLIELWTGSAWRLEPSPDGPASSSLSAISCAAGASCLAVGSPVIAGSNGQWRVVRPASALDAVSCPAAGSCLAVGAGTGGPLYAALTGRAWRTGPMHAPPRRAQSVTVAGVSCTSAASCVAAGDYSYGASALPSSSYRDRTLAERWNGRTWRLLPSANVSRTDRLTAVSCVAPGNCTAVGSSAQQYPLAEHWNGTAWRVEPMARPGGAGYTQLTAVSCASAGFCVTVGTYQGLPIAELWNGRAWRLRWLPQPPADHHSAQLNGVACASPQACMAVGVSGSGLSYAERYDAVSWRLSATRNPT